MYGCVFMRVMSYKYCHTYNNLRLYVSVCIYMMYRNDMNEPSVFNGPEVRVIKTCEICCRVVYNMLLYRHI